MKDLKIHFSLYFESKVGGSLLLKDLNSAVFLSDLLALAVQKFPLKHFFCRRQPSKFYESLTAVAWDPCDSGAIFRDFIDSLMGLLNRFD